jgi:hypothetical protein
VSIVLACTGLTLVTLSLLPSTASATAPQRVGWWNTVSANGTAAPSPTTPAGGMRVAAGALISGAPVAVPQGPQILAYGAVLYALPEGHDATLQLKIAGTAQGTPQLAACPTADDGWAGGDDQPASAEPAYDCSAQHVAGTVSSDGTTVSFAIASPFEKTPGVVSLAIVPDPASTALPTGSSPFAVDIQPPDAGSFTAKDTSPEPTPASSDLLPPDLGSSAPVGAGAPLGLPALNAPPPESAPPATSPAPAQPSAPPRPAARLGPVAAAPPSPLRLHLATALIAAVVVWSLGYGLLGGRVVPLSVPLRRG